MLWIAAVLLALAAGVAGALHYSLGLPGVSHTGPLPAASDEETDLAARLRKHVVAIASKPHNVDHPEALEAAARYIERMLDEAGHKPRPQIYRVDGVDVRNIEVVIEPAAASPDLTTLVIGAHYDSYDTAPGANDNGTGTAAVIELARLLRTHRPRLVRIRLVLFVNEEPPYFQTHEMGSYRYARMLAEQKEPVAAMISLETLGSFSDAPGSQAYPPPFGLVLPSKGDFVAFVGLPGSRDFVRNVIGSFRRHTAFPSVGGVAPGIIPGIDWSDHWSFVKHGYKALMITDTAPFRYAHYHTPQDTPDKVDYPRLARITKGVERVVRELAP